MSQTSVKQQPGFIQGVSLLLPIILTVIGVTVFTATISQMQNYFSDLDNGDYLVNLLQTMPGFWIVVFSPVAGWLADKFGRKSILLFSLAVYAISGVMPFFMTQMYPILATRCIVGMCEAVLLVVTTTMLCDYFKGKARDRWLASQTGFASLSALFIIPLGGYLGAKLGWQGPFLVYLVSIPMLVAVLFLCWEPEREAPSAKEAVNESSLQEYTEIPVFRMAGIIAITVISSVMFYATITQNANAFVTLGVSDPGEIGTYAMYASFGVPIGTFLFWGMSRLHIALLLFINFLLIGSGFVWMSSSSSPMEYVYAANLQQLGCGLMLPTLLVWATRGLTYNIRGRVTGFWQGAFGMGLFISGIALTFLSKQFDGSILLAFGMLGKICLMAAIVAIIAKLIFSKEKKSQ